MELLVDSVLRSGAHVDGKGPSQQGREHGDPQYYQGIKYIRKAGGDGGVEENE